MLLTILLPNHLVLCRYTGHRTSLHLAPAATLIGHATRGLCGARIGHQERDGKTALKPGWRICYRDSDQNRPAPIEDICPRCFLKAAPTLSDLHNRWATTDLRLFANL